jgi:hypothetical protein
MNARAIPIALFVIAVVVRIAAAMIVGDHTSLLPDSLAYRSAAESLLRTGLVGDPFRMPLYPVLIALTGGGKGQLAADILIAACSVLLIYALALKLFADRWAAAFAGLGAAFYPPLVYFSVVGLSETVFLTLVLAAFYAWYRGRFVLGAVAAVLAILTRPAFDIAAPLFIVYFTIVIHRRSVGAAARNLLVYAAIYLALMTPWWIHNYQSYGSFVRLNLALGMVLYAGNNPMNTGGGGNVGEDYDVKQFQHIRDPVARDRALRDAAIKFMLENPRRVVELAALKFVRIWRLWPHHQAYSNWAYTLGLIGSFAPVCLFALVYLLGIGRRELVLISPLLLFIGYYTAVHMLLLGTIRFRLPFEPYLLIFAAMGLVSLLRRVAPKLLPTQSRRA